MNDALPLSSWLQTMRHHLPTLREQYHIETLAIFGSYVRGEQTPTSDLDVLVTFAQAPSLLGFIALENRLSDLLGVKVDLVMRTALKPPLQQRILREAIAV